RADRPYSPASQLTPVAMADALNRTMQQALECHRLGRLPETEHLCRTVLERDPRRFDARYLLGVVLLQQGQFEPAQRELKNAIAIDPKIAAAHNNRAIALMSLNRFEPALKCLDMAAALQPDLPEAFDNRGIVLTKLQRYEDA